MNDAINRILFNYSLSFLSLSLSLSLSLFFFFFFHFILFIWCLMNVEVHHPPSVDQISQRHNRSNALRIPRFVHSSSSIWSKQKKEKEIIKKTDHCHRGVSQSFMGQQLLFHIQLNLIKRWWDYKFVLFFPHQKGK